MIFVQEGLAPANHLVIDLADNLGAAGVITPM